MNEDSDAGRGDGCAVEIVRAADLGPSGQFWVETGATKEVEAQETLGEKLIPEMKREIGVGAAEAGNEVVLEGPDGAFCGIAAVDAGGYELEVYVLFAHVVLQDGGGFVVKALEARAQAGGNEDGKGCLVGS